jgi:hypothetical protein
MDCAAERGVKATAKNISNSSKCRMLTIVAANLNPLVDAADALNRISGSC